MSSKQQGADATQGRWMVLPRTLCLVTHGDDILLMKRAAHKRVFPNKYNGLGGHIERDEDPHQGARREIREESGLEVMNLRLRGTINIDAGGKSGILLFVYTAQAAQRATIDSDEGTLEWVALANITQKDLVDDLPILIPRLFGPQADDRPFAAHVSYTDQDIMQLRFFDEDD